MKYTHTEYKNCYFSIDLIMDNQHSYNVYNNLKDYEEGNDPIDGGISTGENSLQLAEENAKDIIDSMKKYKVEFQITEKVIVDVHAQDEEHAEKLAQEQFRIGNYQDVGDYTSNISSVYDVTDTDDPFNPTS